MTFDKRLLSGLVEYYDPPSNKETTEMSNELTSRIFRLVSTPETDVNGNGVKATEVYPEWEFETLLAWLDDYGTWSRSTILSALSKLIENGELEGNTTRFWFDPERSTNEHTLQAMKRELEKARAEVAARPVIEKEVVKEKYIGIQLLRGKRVVKKIKKHVHKVLPRVLKLAEVGKNIMLFGPTGCGKTVIGQHAAEALQRDFGMISFTSGASESALIGSVGMINGRTVYVDSQFVKIFENGGVFLFDELDAADPNLLLVVNSALANGKLSLPKRTKKPVAERHPDFVCIATANTSGNNADRMYSGRSKLDAATLDRFQVGKIMVDYDEDLERSLVDTDKHQALLDWCWAVRMAIVDQRLERAMSTRFILDSRDMMDAGWTIEEIQDAYFCGWREDEINKVKTLVAIKLDTLHFGRMQ